MLEDNRFLVQACYQLILDRQPDNAGLSDNIAFLDGGGDLNVVIRSLIMSEEFRLATREEKG